MALAAASLDWLDANHENFLHPDEAALVTGRLAPDAGTVALHGWPDSQVFGQASSDGCVRVPDDALQLLRNLPLGTTVMLR